MGKRPAERGEPTLSEPHITLETDQLGAVGEKLRGPLEEQLNSALRAAAERVQAEYRGEPVEEVCRRLLDETRSGLHPDIAAAFQPDHADLYRVAEAVMRGQIG